MYGDPAMAVERIENAELRVEARDRIRELERERELERMRRMVEQRPSAIRMIFAPPEIRLKRARIQALTQAALRKGLK
jgi:hypothetical protein